MSLAMLRSNALVHEYHSFPIGKPFDVSSFQPSVRWVQREELSDRTISSPSSSSSSSLPDYPLENATSKNRRALLGGLVVTAAVALAPRAVMARFILDEETGEYVEVEDVDWQTAWKQRMDKASSMSTDEIFQAARGAGNVELRSGLESESSKKRRAMSACRDVNARSKAGAGTEKECTARVFAGEVDFVLLDAK
jgi:hypothetical protein